MYPYGVVSDTHNHCWSAFATTLPTGVNSRLQMILDETERAADAVLSAGGNVLVHGGDLFHVRGSIAPSVLNPTIDLYKRLIAKGLKVIILAGNHDLEGREAERVSSAVTALEAAGCTIVNKTTVIPMGEGSLALIPWHSGVEALKVEIQKVADDLDRAGELHKTDLVIHAPVDGVIEGLPDHGLTAEWLQCRGFHRVLSGHYHHHKKLADTVYSIGASTHQTWGDVSAKAGFLIVDEGSVKFNASRAPSFVEIDGHTDPSEVPLLVDGNYVRAKISSTKTSDVEALRSYLTDCGAKGVTILAQKEASVTPRAGATIKAGESVEGSIAHFIKHGGFDRESELNALCVDVLNSVRGAAV